MRARGAKGFSLAETMIAVGLLAGLSLGVMKVVNIMNKGQKNVAQRFQVDQIVYAVTMALRDSTTCTQSFLGLDPMLNPAVSSIDGPSGNIAAVSDIFGDKKSHSRVKIQSMQLSGFDKSSVDPTIGSSQLVITFFKKSVESNKRENLTNQQKASDRIVRKIRIQMKLDSISNKIIHCASAESAYAEAMCISLNGNYDSTSNVCSNISILDDSMATPDRPAITATGSMKIVRSLGVGTDASGNPGEITALGIIQTAADIVATDSAEIKASETGMISTSGGNIQSLNGGKIRVESGNIYSNSGTIKTSGNIHPDGSGEVYTVGGSIIASNGNIATGGDIYTTGSGKIDATTSIETSGSLVGRYVYSNSTMRMGGEDVATEPWVLELLTDPTATKAFTSAEKDKVVGHMIHISTDTAYTAMKQDIADHARTKSTINVDCSAAVSGADNRFITSITGNAKDGFFRTCSAALVIPSPAANTKCDTLNSPECNSICVGGVCKEKLWKNYSLSCTNVAYTGGFNTPPATAGAAGTNGTFVCPDKSYMQGWTTQIATEDLAPSGSVTGYTGGATKIICCELIEG